MRLPLAAVTTALLLSAALCGPPPALAVEYRYRGELSDRGQPARGAYSFRLGFYGAAQGGVALLPPTTLDGVAVVDGRFATDVELDPALQSHDVLWLQVDVGDGRGGFVPLAQRTEVRPKALAAGVCWDTQGNAGTNPATDYLGTTDAQPLNFRVGAARALRLELVSGIPNVIGGAAANFVNGVASGATIAGGDSQSITDSGGTIAGGKFNAAGDGNGTTTDADYASVGGGFNNRANGARSTVSGGTGNTALGAHGTIPGGKFNCAGGDYSFAGGLGAKVRPATVPVGGPCADLSPGPATTGDSGTFVWNAADNSSFGSSGPNQFLVRAPGGIGLNTAAVSDATLTIADAANGAPPLLRLYNSTPDQVLGGRILVSENAVSSAGGYLAYDAFNNVFTLGTNTGSADAPTLTLPRGSGRVGIGRTPSANALEVEGNASKTTATAWLANSDARIKQDIEPVAHALATIERVRPVTFRYSAAYRAAHPSIADRRYYNVVAQEYAEVFPDAVQQSGERLPGAAADAGNGILQVDVHPALITSIAAMQELAAQVRALGERMRLVEAENARLRGLIGQSRAQ